MGSRLKCIKHNLTLQEGDRVFEILADYRGDKCEHYKYYVRAKDRNDAKEYFKRTVTWLKMYGVRELDLSEIIQILYEHNTFMKHVIFWRNGATKIEEVYESQPCCQELKKE